MCNLFLLLIFINSLVFRFEDRDVDGIIEPQKEDSSAESYDVTMTAQIAKIDMKDESPVSCYMKIPNSDYTKEISVTYDGMN